MKKICLLWDFDNTLARRNGMWTRSLCNVLDEQGIVGYDPKVIETVFSHDFPWQRHEEAHEDYFDGKTWWEYVNGLITNGIRAVGINDTSLLNKLTLSFREEYLRIDQWEIFPDTLQALDKSMKSGYTNIIVSNHVPELNMLIDGLGLSDYFVQVINSAIVGYEKPNPKIFQQAIAIGDYDLYYMIGDSYNADVIGALNVNINPILVRSKNIMNYEYYCESISDIWRFIDE